MKKNKLLKILLISFVLLFFLNTYNVFLNIIVGDYYSKKAQNYLLIDCSKSIKYSLKSNFYNKNIKNNYYNIAFCIDKLNSQKNINTTNIALDYLNYGYNLEPNDLQYIRDSLNVYKIILINNPDIVDIYNTSNENLYKNTISFFTLLKNKYSNNLGLLIDIYDIENNLNLKNEMEVTKLLILKNRPDVFNWEPRLIN